MAPNCHVVESISSVQSLWKAVSKVVDVPSQPPVGSANTPDQPIHHEHGWGGPNRLVQNIATHRIPHLNSLAQVVVSLFSGLKDVAMKNGWLIYKLTETMNPQPLDQLECSVCNVYCKKYFLEHAAISLSLGHTKPPSQYWWRSTGMANTTSRQLKLRDIVQFVFSRSKTMQKV